MTSRLEVDGLDRLRAQLYLRPDRRDEPPMLWLKSLHVIFVVTWFAGLFYLPRLLHLPRRAPTAAGRSAIS